jgi:hypothetical protein
MTRMLVTVLLYALATAPGSAQNTVSQELLALSEDQRNAAFTRLLQASDRDCDQVIRTLFVSDGLGLDDWEALCRNRTSYSLSLPGEWDASITVLSCGSPFRPPAKIKKPRKCRKHFSNPDMPPRDQTAWLGM